MPGIGCDQGTTVLQRHRDVDGIINSDIHLSRQRYRGIKEFRVYRHSAYAQSEHTGCSGLNSLGRDEFLLGNGICDLVEKEVGHHDQRVPVYMCISYG